MNFFTEILTSQAFLAVLIGLAIVGTLVRLWDAGITLSLCAAAALGLLLRAPLSPTEIRDEFPLLTPSAKAAVTAQLAAGHAVTYRDIAKINHNEKELQEKKAAAETEASLAKEQLAATNSTRTATTPATSVNLFQEEKPSLLPVSPWQRIEAAKRPS